MISKDDLIKEWDEILKNRQNEGLQGGEEREALLQRINESDLSVDELKSLLIEVIKKCLKNRMELAIELAHARAKSSSQ